MDPQNAAIETNFAGYQNGVDGSNAFVKPEIVNAPEYNTPKDEKLSFTPSCPAKATKDYDRIWTLLRK
jgi:spermidine/putrescine transport system substrate-binding protein